VVEHRKLWEGLQLTIVAAMFVTAAVRWGSVPDRIPVHWNAAGQVDGYGGKFVGLLLIPIMSVGLYLLLRYLPRIDPARRNYESFAGTYMLLRVVLMLYLGFFYVVTNLAIGNPEGVPMTSLILGAIGVLFIILGGAMGKFRPNWFAGIRTPWTLTSKLSWVKTHRAGGRVFIVAGLVTMVGAFIGGEWAIWAMMGVIGVGVIFLFVYSYFVWRDDPDRIPAQEVTPGPD
jgi:uncharacterized membrane protein